MELTKCVSCEKVFLGHRNLKLCPICAVAAKGKEVVERQPADHRVGRMSLAAVAVAH